MSSPPPRFSTPRNPGHRTYGAAIAKVAAALGTPLMPWQRHVVDVACEIDPEGLPVHRLVVVTVPRQSGKTTLWGPLALHRLLTVADASVWLTAQKRND